MRLRGRYKRFFTWMACLAVLAGALASALSHALQAGSSPSWAEVCTALVAKAAGANDAGRSPPGPAVPGEHTFEHCPYCSLHAGGLGLPPAPLCALPMAPLRVGMSVALLAAPRTLFVWLAAQPRAPPRAA